MVKNRSSPSQKVFPIPNNQMGALESLIYIYIYVIYIYIYVILLTSSMYQRAKSYITSPKINIIDK